MRPFLLAIAALLAAATPAAAFDLQGHRGARGLAPENTLDAFSRALEIGVTTLELDLGVTKDGIVVVSHDRRLNPDHTRDADGKFLDREGPAIRSLTFAELQRYDVGRLKPGTRYAAGFSEQKGVDGARIPALTELFDLVRRAKADHVRFNIETKLTPTSGDETPEPEAFAAAVIKVVRDAGFSSRVTLQSFDWLTLRAAKKIAPEIERACLTIERGDGDNIQRGRAGPSPWTAGLDVETYGGSTPLLVKTADCNVWSPYYRDVTPHLINEAKALGLKVIPWTVNDVAEMKPLIDAGVDGLISDYPDRLRAVLSERKIALPPQIVR
jgi:glycerophosphoryl diester phosphodiesterase